MTFRDCFTCVQSSALPRPRIWLAEKKSVIPSFRFAPLHTNAHWVKTRCFHFIARVLYYKFRVFFWLSKSDRDRSRGVPAIMTGHLGGRVRYRRTTPSRKNKMKTCQPWSVVLVACHVRPPSLELLNPEKINAPIQLTTKVRSYLWIR